MSNTTIPPLPKPAGDSEIILDIYTHRSLVNNPNNMPNDEYGNAIRLEVLGESILRLVVVNHLYQQKNPQLNQDQIKAEAETKLSDDNMLRWVDSYNLRERIRSSPQTQLDPAQLAREFMHTYIGAIYIRNGMQEVQNWISKLIQPDAAPPDVSQGVQGANGPPAAAEPDGSAPPAWSPPPPGTYASGSGSAFMSSGMPAAPSSSPPPLPPQPGAPPPAAYKITLALMNQIAAQRGFQVTYPAQSQGPPHAPVWNAACHVNGHEYGRGTGKTQKIAKEEAAENAWRALGW